MTSQLHPSHLSNARCAILRRFRDLNTPPNGIAKRFLFSEQMKQYSGGYFETAMQQLADEQYIEVFITGHVRLTLQGYETAQQI